MPLRILIAPDKFKGSLSATEAAEAIAAGIARLDPDAVPDLCPIADGGEGFMETLRVALDGGWVACPAVDALGRTIDSRYVVAETAGGMVAVIEMAETAGLWRLDAGDRNPRMATTRGVGMQIADAAGRGVDRIILGLGGSATNDGGAGMAAALGVAFLDAAGGGIDPLPSNLDRVATVVRDGRIALPPITAACDVDNPLLGESGSTAVFSAQKGAAEDEMPALESALGRLVGLSGGGAAAVTPGAGAAGGLGFGLLHFAGAALVPGFDLVADLLDLGKRVDGADHVVTGEGSIDHQSLAGKGPVALARLARSRGVPVTGFCGIADAAARDSGVFDSLHALADTGAPVGELMADAARFLTRIVVESRFVGS